LPVPNSTHRTMGRTTIEVDEATRDRLRRFKAVDGDTYDEAITKLLDAYERPQAAREATGAAEPDGAADADADGAEAAREAVESIQDRVSGESS